MKTQRHEIDMCNGPLLLKMLQFSFPLMLSGVLQLLFNAADIVVVGRFSGKEALAAVGSTSSLINLLINVFMGLSIGTNVLVARYAGARDEKNAQETIHTAITVSFLCGIGLIFVGWFFSRPLLVLMGTPEDVLEKAALYMRIYFLSMPALMLYNFGSAILRAVGDTKRPLYFLSIAGVVNVIFNLIFVVGFGWSVAGVAAATAISQILSAAMVLGCMMKEQGICRVHVRQLRIHGEKLRSMLKIGIPAGIQGSLFSLSNTIVQSSINSFGSVAMAGSAAASNIEGMVWTSMSAIMQATLSFTSQNMGAKKFSRINRISLLGVGIVSTLGIVLGGCAVIFARPLLGIYNSDPAVIAIGVRRMYFICIPYFTGGIMDVMAGSMRGLGYSMLPTLVSLLGVCGLRMLWIFTVFANAPSLDVLFFVYPLSWVVTAAAHILCFIKARRNIPAEDIPDSPFY